MRENGLVRRTISFFLAFTMVFSLCANFNLTVNAETASDSLSQEGSETGSGDASSNDLQNLENTPAVASNDFQEGDTPSILGGSDSNYYDLSDYLNWEGDNSSSIKINGKELTEGGTTEVTAGDSVEITLGWNFADGSVPTSEKDVLVYTIPEGIQMADKTGTLYFGQQNVGTYQISGNKISLLYTDKAFFEEGSRGGKLEISGILSEKVIQEATKETYTFSFPGSKTFTIDMDKDHSGDGVTVTKKNAKLNDANGLNNLTADFVVAIKTVGDYKNVVFQDEMGSYLSLKGDVSFYTDESCSTPYTGRVSKDADQPSNGFKYTIAELSDQTIYAKYTVNVDKKIYTITNIYDGNQTGTITNTAKVKTEDGKENSSSARVEFDPRSWVTKTGSYNSTTEQIDWTITINKGGNFDISGTTLKDVISDKTCELVAGSFKTNIKDLTYEKLLAGSYVFPEGSTGEYTISYSTTKGTTSETSAVTKKNTVTVNPWGDSSEISGEANVQIGKNWDYVDKECLTSGNSQTVDWKITVHVPATGIENLVVQEFIPDEMSYVDGSLKEISGFTGDVSVAKDPYNNSAYTFTFGKIEGTGKAFDISFQIQTKIDQLPSSNKTYTNKVEVNHVQDTVSYEYKFENYLEKTVNNGQITDGKMNWYLHVKQLPSDSKTAVIKDTLPDGMSYVEGSLKTSYQLHWGFDEQTVYPIGVDRSDINVSVNGKVVTITLTGTALSYAKTHSDLWIRYTTKEELNISDAGTTKNYKNEANITVDNVTFPTVSAEVSHQIDKETFIDKYAVYNKDTAPYVNYTITVNEKGLTLSSDNQLTLIDQLGSALDYKEGSLKIDGVSASSSQLSYDAAKRQLTITVSDGVKHTITYQAAVNLNVGEKLDENNASNNVTLTGKGEKEVEKKTALVGSVVDSSGSSWSTGVSVSVYKYDAADRTKALEGAEFTVYKITLNANNEVTGKEKVRTVKTGADGYASISGLYRNTLYMLQETDAPDGYKGSLSAQYFAFAEKDKDVVVPTSITAAGLTEKVLIIDGTHRSYNFSVANEESKSGSLTFTKTIKGDVTAEDLKSIEFTVKKGTDTVKTVKLSEMTKDANGKYSYTLSGLEPGEYSVTESNAEVDGYNVKVTYSVTDGKTTVADQKTATVDITNEYTKQTGSLTFTKTIKGDVTAEDLKSIEFTVKKGTDTVKTVKLSEMTKDANGKYSYTLSGLEPGEYSVTESNAEVDGYNVKVTYSVTDGKTTVADQKTATVDITDEYTKVPHDIDISKVDATNGKELAGAQLTLTDADGKTVDSWISDGSKHTVKIPAGEYTLTEDQAPLGYFKAESITFTVDTEGTVYIDGESDLYPNRVVMQDKRNPDEYGGGKHDVEISKIDTGNGKELEGAQLTVKDSEGNVVETWTSEGKSHVVKVPAGEYTLTEDQAPLGYEKAETITFTVDEKGKITVGGKEVTKVTMEDARTTKEVEISKVDATNSKELSGAKLKITDADGNVIDEWTSGNETHFVKLSYGEYTLTEITAPKGYEIAESITFTVGKDGKISSTSQGAVDNMKVTMKDEPSIDSNSEKPKKPTGNTTTGNNNNGNTGSTGNSSRTNTSAPKTGDFDTPQTWLLLMMLALAGLGTAGYGYKKRK